MLSYFILFIGLVLLVNTLGAVVRAISFVIKFRRDAERHQFARNEEQRRAETHAAKQRRQLPSP